MADDSETRTIDDRRQGDRRGQEGVESDRSSAQLRKAIRSELAAELVGRRRVRGPDAPPVVELDHVSLAFDQPILEDVSFAAREGETIAIVGESGTGKSTT